MNKGVTYDLNAILNGNGYIDRFEGGSLININLNQYSYHRYGVATGGIILDIDQIGGYQYFKPFGMDIGDYYDMYSVNINRRGVVYVENENIGLTANVYIGVADFSSVVIHGDVGTFVEKGDENGYFQYGGSTIAVLFEKDMIQEFIGEIGDPLKYGQRIAIAKLKQNNAPKHEL